MRAATLLLLGITLTLGGCEGRPGPQGRAGPDGQAGPQGERGPAGRTGQGGFRVRRPRPRKGRERLPGEASPQLDLLDPARFA